jgi:hypothetical protein
MNDGAIMKRGQRRLRVANGVAEALGIIAARTMAAE